MTPEESANRARQIAAMPPGHAKHCCFDELVNEIARQHGHGEAVDIFVSGVKGDHAITANPDSSSVLP